MYPRLLDDQSLFTEFEKFIEAIDNIHELALDGQQQFPVSCWSICFGFLFGLYFLVLLLACKMMIILSGCLCIIFLQKESKISWLSFSWIYGKIEVLFSSSSGH